MYPCYAYLVDHYFIKLTVWRRGSSCESGQLRLGRSQVQDPRYYTVQNTASRSACPCVYDDVNLDMLWQHKLHKTSTATSHCDMARNKRRREQVLLYMVVNVIQNKCVVTALSFSTIVCRLAKCHRPSHLRSRWRDKNTLGHSWAFYIDVLPPIRRVDGPSACAGLHRAVPVQACGGLHHAVPVHLRQPTTDFCDGHSLLWLRYILSRRHPFNQLTHVYEMTYQDSMHHIHSNINRCHCVTEKIRWNYRF